MEHTTKHRCLGTDPIRLDVKALSVNEAFRGRKFKTPRHSEYEKEVLFSLPLRRMVDFDFRCKISLKIEFGLSSKASDLDNCVKLFVDCLQKKYGFNDNQIYELILQKTIVKKGREFIKFEFGYF